LQLNQLFSNAVHFTMNLQRWSLKSTLHPVKYFTVIVERDISIQLGEKCSEMLKKDLANEAPMNFCPFINFCRSLLRYY